MYALIDFKDPIKMVVGISEENIATNLGQLVKFFENNVICIKDNYSSKEIVKPEITFHLGKTYVSPADSWRETNEFAVVVEGEHNLDESFVINTPDVYISSKDAIDKASKAKKLAEEKLELEITRNKHLIERIEQLEASLINVRKDED